MRKRYSLVWRRGETNLGKGESPRSETPEWLRLDGGRNVGWGNGEHAFGSASPRHVHENLSSKARQNCENTMRPGISNTYGPTSSRSLSFSRSHHCGFNWHPSPVCFWVWHESVRDPRSHGSRAPTIGTLDILYASYAARSTCPLSRKSRVRARKDHRNCGRAALLRMTGWIPIILARQRQRYNATRALHLFLLPHKGGFVHSI